MIPLKFLKSKKVVLSSVDSPRRDLGWRLLLAKNLAEQGVTTVLGKPHDIFLVLSLLRGALIFGRFGGNTGRGRFDSDFIKQMELTHSSMYFLHDEGAFYFNDEYEAAVKRIYPEEFFSRPFLKKVYFWGERQRSIFRDVYDDCSLEISGAPRLDYLRFLLTRKAAEKSEFQNRKKNYVLICSRFAGISPAKDDVSLISDSFLNIRIQTEGLGKESEGDLFREQVKRWCAVSIDRARFIDAVYDLARANPDTDFLFRPHPGEDASLYRTLYRFLANVTVDKSGDLSEVLQGASLFIHSESTSGVEAAVIGVPSINFSTRDDDGYTIAGASEIGEVVRDASELEKAFRKLLFDPKSSLCEDAEILFPYVKNSKAEFNAINKICFDINKSFRSNNTEFKISARALKNNFLFYFFRKMVYRLKSIIFKVGRDDKAEGFRKASVHSQWLKLEGGSASIKVSSGLIFVFPNR
tara:strand:- start:10889 stop:12289 length:1401 start_codon:yes stop_codon:yes gene_type:complete